MDDLKVFNFPQAHTKECYCVCHNNPLNKILGKVKYCSRCIKGLKPKVKEVENEPKNGEDVCRIPNCKECKDIESASTRALDFLRKAKKIVFWNKYE